MKWVDPRGWWMIVAWEDFDVDERGRQLVPGTELVYGRTVHAPIARVLDYGAAAGLYLGFRGRPDGVMPGDQVVASKDLGELFELELSHQGRSTVQVQAIAVAKEDPRTGRSEPTDEIAAVIRGDEVMAIGRRILGHVVPCPAHHIWTDRDLVDRVRVVDIGEDVQDVAIGDIVLVHRDANMRTDFAHMTGHAWVSVPAPEVLAVEEEEASR